LQHFTQTKEALSFFKFLGVYLAIPANKYVVSAFKFARSEAGWSFNGSVSYTNFRPSDKLNLKFPASFAYFLVLTF